MIDFSDSTDCIYDMFGFEATYYQNAADTGTSCTVLYDRQGQESAEYGVVEIARVVVRKSEVASPARGEYFEIDSRTWRIEYILGAADGTNELETALACIDVTHMGIT